MQRLEHKVASGVVWSLSEKLLSMVVQMVVSIIVARQLMPEDFGVMAIMTFFTSVALAIVDSGFSQTLIRKQSPTDEEYRTVLSFNIVISFALYALFVALAPAISRFYDHEIIATIAPVLFLVLPINSLCVVQTVMFTREFRFALLSKIVFAASLISGVVAVVMALLGCGIWSLVAQRLLMMGIKAIAFWSIRRWRTTAKVNLRVLGAMAPFSLRLLATDLIASIYNNVAQLFIGKMYSTAQLGFYSQAQKLKDLPVTSTMQAVQGVTYPALSQLKDDKRKFTDGFERIVMLLSFVMFLLLLGERWMPTVPYFRILALSGLFYPLAMVAYNVLKSLSDGRVIVRLEVAKRVIMTLILCVAIPQGVTAVAWGMTAMAMVEFLLNTVAAMRYMELGVVRLVRAIIPSLLLSVVMYLATTELSSTILLGCGVALRLVVVVIVAIFIYVLLAALLRFRALREAWVLLSSMLTKSE